jgi:hypothetical protein
MLNNDKTYLVLTDKPNALTQIEIKERNETVKINLLNNLVPKNSEYPRVVSVTNILERKFVEYCFDQSKKRANNKIYKVEKVLNKYVQSNFMNHLKHI